MKAVDTVSANETELLELTLMEQVSLNEIMKELKVASKGNKFASFQPIPHHAAQLSSSVAILTSPQHDASMMDEARSTLTDAMMNHFKRSDEMKKTEVDDEDEQRYSPTRMEYRQN